MARKPTGSSIIDQHIMKMIGEIVLEPGGRPQVTGEVCRVTKHPLGGSFGPDQNRRLVVELIDGDVIRFRPMGCRKGIVSAPIKEVYRWAMTRSKMQ